MLPVFGYLFRIWQEKRAPYQNDVSLFENIDQNILNIESIYYFTGSIEDISNTHHSNLIKVYDMYPAIRKIVHEIINEKLKDDTIALLNDLDTFNEVLGLNYFPSSQGTEFRTVCPSDWVEENRYQELKKERLDNIQKAASSTYDSAIKFRNKYRKKYGEKQI